MWEAGKLQFTEVLLELQPQVLLVLGAELRSHLPALSADLQVCYSVHPSYPGFSYEPASTQLKSLLVKVRDAMPNLSARREPR